MKTPRRRGCLAVLIALWLGPLGVSLAGRAEAAELVVAIDWMASRGAKPDAPPTVTVSAHGHELGEPVLHSFPDQGEAVLELEAGVRWRLRVEAEGFWGEERTVRLTPAGDRVVIPLWPAGTLAGRLVVDEGSPVPPRLEARLTGLGGRGASSAPEKATVICPVDQGALRCVAPAGVFDLVLAIADHGPIRHWTVSIPRGRAAELGELRFYPSASIVGHVEASDGEPLGDGVEVVLLDPSAASAASAEEAPPPLATTLATAEGFFQFSGVPAATYVAAVRDSGFLPATSLPFDVGDQLEMLLTEPLRVHRAAALEVVFHPPLDPFDEPWQFELIRVDAATGSAADVSQETADDTGQWRRDLRVGAYQLRVRGAINPFWVVRQFALEAGGLPLQIDVGIVGVAGSVRVGDRPLAAAIEWRLASGAPIDLTSDASGAFQGYLPSAGSWSVVVKAFDRRIPYPDIDVYPAPGDWLTQVDIELPDTEVSGLVVDQFGQPVEGAAILIRWPDGGQPSVTLTSEEDGSFGAPGLPAGVIMLQAQYAGKQLGLWAHAQLEPGLRTTVPPLRVERPVDLERPD